MNVEWTPMRWPSAWTDPAALSLAKSSGINCLLIDPGAALDPVRAAALQQGLHVVSAHAAPVAIVTVKGEWPGVRLSRIGGNEAASGPTGVPWVNSNGWRVRLASALNPQSAIWVEAPPKEHDAVTAASYVMAIADSAAYGGRWILSLDTQFAADVGAGKPAALKDWQRITAATAFFAVHPSWSRYSAEATVGVLSDFTGPNQSLSNELLNLLARAGQHSRIILKDKAIDTSFPGLRAVIYSDTDPPSSTLRKQVIAFVEAGGLLITGPAWDDVPSAREIAATHPRFSVRALGQGRVAVANKSPDDPYMLASDSSVLISHRYDLVRFWNSGAAGSFYTTAEDRKRAVVHLLFYADRGPNSASVRVAGPFRTATISTIDQPAPQRVKTQAHPGAIEVYLPAVPQYVALELGV